MANFEQVLVVILVAVIGFLMFRFTPIVTKEQEIKELSEEIRQLRDKIQVTLETVITLKEVGANDRAEWNKPEEQEFAKQDEIVAFSVYTPARSDYKDDEVLSFSSIRVDTHSAYNTKTGMFTAPVDGTYYFAATTCTGHKECVTHGILHDNTRLVSSCICAKHSCTSTSVIVYLKENERVWVQILAISVLSDDHHRRSSFSGFLIERDEMVAFSVYAPARSKYKVDEVLTFSSIRVDTHSAYNTTRGMFTAPTDGTYYFAATTCTGHKDCVTHGILYYNTRLVSSCTCAKHSCTSSSVIVYLKKRERVWVQSLDVSILSDDHHRRSSFSGFLIGS